jgi:uncharacterized protein YprB with RNaseH-like and TPR domain
MEGKMTELERALPGEEVSYSPWGKAYVITTDLKRYVPDAESVAREIATRLESFSFDGIADKLKMRENILSSDILFFDLETCGLAYEPIFLSGILIEEGGEFFIRQFLARDFDEESAILAMTLMMMDTKKLLVTFNGRRFDVPYLLRRSDAGGIPFAEMPAHLDMLDIAKRRWAKYLPNCRLTTLESHLLNRHREGDIPGSLIPAAYHRFVRTGNPSELTRIIYHNALDLITLAQLTALYAKS